MDPKRFRQWSPPVVAGVNVSPGTILSKAISVESNYAWDPKRQQFRSKKVIELEGRGKKVPTPKGSPKKKTEASQAPTKAAPEKPKAGPKKISSVKAKAPQEAPASPKSGPKKIEGAKPFVGPKSNRQMGEEWGAKQKEGPKLLPTKTATSVAPKAEKPKKPKAEKKIKPISSPEVKVSKPSPKPAGPQPIGTGAGVMTSSTGGPQLSGHTMPVTVLGDTKKAVANLDELEAMSKAKFKTGTGQVGKRKAGSSKVQRAAKPAPKVAPKPMAQMQHTARGPALKTGVGGKLGTMTAEQGKTAVPKVKMTGKQGGTPASGAKAGPKVEQIRPGQMTPSKQIAGVGQQPQGSSAAKPTSAGAGPKPIGAETPAAAGAASTPGAIPAPAKPAGGGGGDFKMTGTGGPQLTGGGGKQPAAVTPAQAAAPAPAQAAAPAAAGTPAQAAAPAAAAGKTEAPAPAAAAPAEGGGKKETKPAKGGGMTGTGGPQLGGQVGPRGSAAGIGYAEGSFIGAETGGSKTGGTAAANVAATEAAGVMSGGGGQSPQPSRQTTSPSGYLPSRGTFTGRGGPGGGTAAQSGPGQKPSQSSMRASLTAMKSFMSTPRGISGSRRLPGGE